MNKKGFISISIIFSFMILFLLLLSMILVSYSNNRIKLGLYKETIKIEAYCNYCTGEGCDICEEQ